MANINAALSISGGVVTSLDPFDANDGLVLPDENASLDQGVLFATTMALIASKSVRLRAGRPLQAVLVSTSPPVPASEGDNWYDPDTGRAYVYYNDGDSIQWVEANPSWNGSVQDGYVTPAKLSTGGPSWNSGN